MILKSSFKELLPNEFNFDRKQGFAAPMSDLIVQKEWKQYFLEYFNKRPLLDKFYMNELTKDDKSISINAEKIFGIAFLNKWIDEKKISFNG